MLYFALAFHVTDGTDLYLRTTARWDIPWQNNNKTTDHFSTLINLLDILETTIFF